MSDPRFDTLIDAQRALIAALDADDANAIAQATLTVENALAPLRDAHFVTVSAEVRAAAFEARRLADAARIRVNVLADMTARRLARLSGLTGRGRAGSSTYGRNGRIAL